MPASYTLNSEAILAFYLDEEGANVVQDIFEQVQAGEAEGNLSIITLTEICYILSRVNLELAEQREKKLRLMGLKIVPIEDNGLWREAAHEKSIHSMSLADAFAVATAKAFKSKLVVGSDKEFSGTNVSLLRIRK
jgi:ribonuclease VapC